MAESTIPDERVLDVLRASGNFGSLDATVLRDLCRLLDVKTVPGGHVVYREGDPAHTMFFLISGRLRVSRRAAGGELQPYNEIRPGESVGEAGLILQLACAADITALRDSTVAMLSRADFERLMLLHPLPLNRVFARAIHHHSRHASQTIERRHAQIFVVVPLHGDAQAHAVCASLAQAFSRLARFLNGTATGVVLGGGARGFVRLGVWRALEQSGIVADLIGGNSMGALIRAQYACDVPIDEIRERTLRFTRGGERPTLPVISIVCRRRVEGDLRIMFGERAVDQLWRPFALMPYRRAQQIAEVGYRYAMQEIAAWGGDAGKVE